MGFRISAIHDLHEKKTIRLAKQPFCLAVVLLLVLSGCSVNKEIPLGGDKDEHGCIGSAGYIWCEAKQKCLRVWEEPCVEGDKITACYECEGLGEIRVEYYAGDGASVLVQDKRHHLKRGVAASGARYEGKNIMIWDKGSRAFFVRENKEYNCVVIRCQ